VKSRPGSESRIATLRQGNAAVFAVHHRVTAVLLRGFALEGVETLLADSEAVVAQVPLRHFVTPGGRTMSVRLGIAL
jgi:hypothetical protein